MEVDTAMKSAGTTHVFLSAVSTKNEEELWPYLVLQEAAGVVAACKVNTGFRGIIDEPAQIAKCFLYMLELCCQGSQWIDYDLGTHVANYWVCDGIIHQPQHDDDDGLWRSAEALQCEMILNVDYRHVMLARFVVKSKPYWTSPMCGFARIPDGVSVTPNGDMMYPHCYDKLSVLKLAGCTFDLQSPPFLCCHSLRFLWIDHCQVIGTSTCGVAKEQGIRRCFQRLWVLDVRDTDCSHILSAQMLGLMTQLRELNVMGASGWDIGQLHGRLPNIRKLRVKGSGVRCSCPEDELFSGMNRMELLDFSGNYNISPMRGLSGPGAITNSSCLETVIIADGFYLDEVSFRGCTRLKDLVLIGWMGVHTLDISGTAVKTLDLTTTEIPHLDELYLLGCQKLCAITWPPEYLMKVDLSKLCIDTTQSSPTAQARNEKEKKCTTATTSGTSVAAVRPGNGPTSEFDWHISVKDARLLKSLEPVYSNSRKIYVEVSSPTTIYAGGSKDQGIRSGSSREQVNLRRRRNPAPVVYGDITVDHRQQQACEDDADAGDIMGMWPCPDVPHLPQESCYMHIQDRTTKTELLPQDGKPTSRTITVPRFVSECAKILHVHDSLAITSTPSYSFGSEWDNLEWCRIERCPKLESIFSNDGGYVFCYQLRTLWASQLLKSRYISKSSNKGFHAFPHLKFLHLDLCPRLIHALPLETWARNQEDSFCLLETLEIIWCGDVKEIFPLHTDDNYYKSITREFTKLKHIHLHELPSLQSIYGGRMSAPNLETVKIRGCWNLMRLPDIGNGDKTVECDCEKEWWDKLEWDDRSQATRYKPIHPRYYKKTVLRSTVLR
jgi:hypothetical protein